MTSKTISTYVAAGYTLSADYDHLTITAAGGVGGTGLYCRNDYQATTISNAGTIHQTVGGTSYYGYISGGVFLATAGVVVNQQTGFIGGDNGVIMYGGGTVNNFGTISATDSAIYFYQATTGTVANGDYFHQSALIEGKNISSVGVLANFGTIKAQVDMYYGGQVTNGTYTDLNARIEGDTGILSSGVTTITNYGTIVGTGGSGSLGVRLGLYSGGGALTNGTIIDPTALIEGYGGVSVSFGSGTIANYGTIEADGVYAMGVQLSYGGSLANGVAGAAHNAAALIEGYSGVVLQGTHAATLTNFGTILGFGHGTAGAYGGAGVYINSGVLTNGGSGEAGAFISGYRGVVVSGTATVTNFGTIRGVGGTAVRFSSSTDELVVEAGCAFKGAVFGAGGTLDLDSGTGKLQGLLAGGNVTVSGSMAKTTFTNFGAVEIGAAGHFKLKGAGTIGAGQSLIDAGALSVGKTLNVGGDLIATGQLKGGGTLALVGGTAAFNTGASLTVAHVAVSGTASVSVATNLTYAGLWTQSAGTLSVAAGDTLTFTGTGNALSGTVTGAGTVAFSKGGATFSGGAALTVARITVAGSATTISVGENLTYAGQWTQSAGTVSVASGDTLTLAGTGNSLSGAVSGAGGVALVGGSDTLSGISLTAEGLTISGAAVTLSGTIANAGKISATSSGIVISAAGAILTGGGTVALSNNTANKIMGAIGAATLSNLDNTISGAGALGGGSMTLNNQAAGVINANGSKALTIDTGAATVVNAGLIKASGAGGLTILSAVNNSGVLSANGGNLTVTGAVSGGGKGLINGGTLDFTSTFNENVTFSGATGILEMAQSRQYTGSITGFSKSGGTLLDLVDIAFVGAGEATFKGDATSGVLKVTDGVHTARITLIGDYTTSSFVAASDGHGGTVIHDPTPGAAPPPPAAATPRHQFIAAMAGWSAHPGSVAVATTHGLHGPSMLLAPRMRIA
jgi:hypothetical protein